MTQNQVTEAVAAMQAARLELDRLRAENAELRRYTSRRKAHMQADQRGNAGLPSTGHTGSVSTPSNSTIAEAKAAQRVDMLDAQREEIDRLRADASELAEVLEFVQKTGPWGAITDAVVRAALAKHKGAK